MITRYVKYIITAVFVHLLFIPAFSRDMENDVHFYRLTTRDGLSQMSVLSIYQDTSGAMWFGTTEGLDRYNGFSVESFVPSDHPELHDNNVRAIVGNGSGEMYAIVGNDLILFDINTLGIRLLKRGVNAIAFGGDGLWAVRGDSVMRYDHANDRFVPHLTLDNSVSTVLSIHPATSGELWIGTVSELLRVDPDPRQPIERILTNVRISCLFADSRNDLWAGSDDSGVYRIAGPDRRVTNYSSKDRGNTLLNNRVRDIDEDGTGDIWVGTFYGLYRFRPDLERWEQYVPDDDVPYGISHSSVFSLHRDAQGTMWVGTYYGGANYFNPETDIFTYYGASRATVSSLSFPYVGRMAEDRHGNLWICTEGGALNRLNLETRAFSHFTLRKKDGSDEDYNQKSIWYDAKTDRLYIGMYNGGLCVFDVRTGRSRIVTSESFPGLPNTTVNHIESYGGMLALMTDRGLTAMDPVSGRFLPLSDDPAVQAALRRAKRLTFHIDGRERLWIVTDGLTRIDLGSGAITDYRHDPSDGRSIGKCQVDHIFESRSGDLYFATAGSGIFRFDEEADNFENYTKEKNGLISDFCYAIGESPSGNLILLHNNGLSFVDPARGFGSVFRSARNFPVTGFNAGNGIHVAADGEIFIGGVNGLVSFFERDLEKVEKDYRLYFDKLYIDNEYVRPGDRSRVLSAILSRTGEIELKYSQNNFRIEFASSSYLRTIEHDFEYMLEGFDRDWAPAGARMISYTNLDPGKYTLVVRDAGDHAPQCTLGIVIKPPYYNTSVARLLYAILILSALYGILVFYRWRAGLQASVEFEQQEMRRINELDRMKCQFFANVSHEFRTPLTLISGYTESLMMQKELPRTALTKIEKISANTGHLLDLMTELLYFGTQEQGYNRLKIEKTELITYITEIYKTFRDYAVRKEIKYQMYSAWEELYVYIDPLNFRKAVYNLISNAFKYTPEGGEIMVSVRPHEKNTVSIQVADTGIGIPAEHFDDIFERFYQLEYRPLGRTLGTGIGLAVAKEIVTGHKGEIGVSSEPGKGSVFTILLRLGNAHFSEEELREPESAPVVTDGEAEQCEPEELDFEAEPLPGIPEEDRERLTMLIVDDNTEIVDLLEESFGGFYRIVRAGNGKRALEIVREVEPDIVVSDVLMPGISGKELCYRIKNNVNTFHIPVVLLSSQTSEKQVLEGYMYGADAYLAKPFNTKILLAICNNLVRNRRILYNKFLNQATTAPSFDLIIAEDRQLIDKTIGVIRDNLANPEFGMDKLGLELGFGRSKLFSRIKQITGMTPHELTLNIKLDEAVNLLENSLQKNISEIAYELGFSSTKYFSKRFKSFYGITPQEWRKKHQAG